MKKPNKSIQLALIAIFKGSKLIKALKMLKFAKPLVTVVTLFVSTGLYAVVYEPVIAVGLVVSIFIHEMGHIIALNKEGYKVSGPVFIPFLGAAIFAPRDMDRRQEAVIGIGGPILGSLFAFLLIGLYYLTAVTWLLSVAYMGIFINLFNMIPLRPLDGGRVTQAVGTWFKIVGLGILMMLTVALKDPGLLVIWIIVLDDIDFIPPKIRLWLGGLVWISLVGMIIFHISTIKMSLLSSIMDVLIGLLFVLLLGLKVYHKKEFDSDNDIRPTLSKGEKIKWFLVWFITTTILFGSLILLTPSIKAMVIA